MLSKVIKDYEGSKEVRKFVRDYTNEIFTYYREQKMLPEHQQNLNFNQRNSSFLDKMDLLILMLEEELPKFSFNIFSNCYLTSPRMKKKLSQIALDNAYMDDSFLSKLQRRIRLRVSELLVLLEIEKEYKKDTGSDLNPTTNDL